MRMIVGLGNPGKEYDNTRHNVGFYMLNRYLEHKQLALHKTRFNGKYIITDVNGEKTLFLEPQAYMNLSGSVVQKFAHYYKIPAENIIVIYDDKSLPLGNIRLRERGTSAGHNGLKNIEEALGTVHYKRIKIGIANAEYESLSEYVLDKFTKEEQKIIKRISDDVNIIIDETYKKEFLELMSIYNHRVKQKKDED